MSSPDVSATFALGMSIGMIMGMILGMVASPLMMKLIKIVRHRRKLNRLFHEISQIRQNRGEDDPVADTVQRRDNNSL